MLRKDYYYKQPVTEGEIDGAFDAVEQAIWDLATDHGLYGIVAGLSVSDSSPTPSLNVVVDGGKAYDKLGRRLFLGSPQSVPVDVDELGSPTTVVGVSNARWVSIFLKFRRVNSDPRTDGNGTTVQFNRAEGVELLVAQGPEGALASLGSLTRPALRSDAILLIDIPLTHGQSATDSGDFDETRREVLLSFAGTPRSLGALTIKDGIVQVLQHYNNHASGAVDKHASDAIAYTTSPVWKDGVAVTSGTVTLKAQVDAIVNQLAASVTTSGADRVGAKAVASSPRSLSVGSIEDQLTELLGHRNELASTSATDGATLIGAKAATGYSSGTVRSQLDAVISGVQAISGAKTFDDIKVSGTVRYKVTSRNKSKTFLTALLGHADWSVIGSGLSGFAYQCGGTTVRSLWIPLDLPEGSTLTSVDCYAVGAGGHVALPGTMPAGALGYIDTTTGAATNISAVNDTAANTTAYQAVHTWSLPASSHPVSNANRQYYVRITSEGGANAVAGFEVIGVRANVTITEIDDW